jgi:hypothetical protein
MGLFGALKGIAKARMMGTLLRRGVGGKVGTGLMVAWLGKKAYDAMKSKRPATYRY